ncbi:MAG: regulatory protein RecX [Gemmatimonadetes bacterium]|nr:regulatory protein RecX [Gemmatimonadota bacterium]
MPDPRLTRIEPLPPKGLRARVFLDEGDPLEVALEALELGRLGVGDELTSAVRRTLLDADADVAVREAALGLLSHRARTRRELKRKLRAKRFDAARIDACLDRLEERGLLSDAAVAAAFVRDRLKFTPRGRSRLASELRAKGVDADVAQESIALVFEDEEVRDADLARSSAGAWLARQPADVAAALGSRTHTPASTKAKRRLYGYLARRGFRGDALDAAMRHAEERARAR